MATVSEALTIAVRHHQSGRLQAAEQIYRQILALEPNHADALHLLGVIAHQAGEHELAVEHMRRAIALKANVAVFHNNLGNALRAQGKPDEAAACYRRALELKPDFAEVHNNLGVAWKEQGKPDEAAASYRRALKLNPDDAEAHNNLGNVLKEQKKPDEAVACYRWALELKPDYAEAHYNLGAALQGQGKLDEAAACYRCALELKPDYAPAHNNLGNTLKEQGKLDEAVACYRRTLELKPGYAEAHSNLGSALKEQGKLDEAAACYRRALELKPDYAAAHNNLGSALQEMGDLRGAEDSFRAALRHDGRLALAHCNLAELLGGKLSANDLAAQRRLLEDMELTDLDRSLLHFGLAKVLDARGEYAEAARHLNRGNALQLSEWRKRGREYDPKEHKRLVTRTIAACTPEFFQRVRGFGVESELPVFVVGLPRSGTTLVEQILASHSQVFGAGELGLAHDTMTALGSEDADCLEGLSRLDRQTAGRLAARHLERLRALSPTALRIVDKMPENYLYLGLLASLFPRAKFIHCRRDLRDVAVSCWTTHFQGVRWTNDREHIASRFYQYQRLMEHWRKVLPAPLLEVEYEATVADLEGVARKLVAWCNLAWEPKCLEFHQTKRPVRTASAVQVRRPVFKTSVARWKHYEGALASLFARLES
jgi:tetratricopeptide (TPR) repeat protein